MPVKNSLVLVLTATTVLAAGAAFAADQSSTPPAPSANQTAVDKDVGKLSADGMKAFGDVALTRLAIFDGRVADAKKYINEADSAMGKAKTDETVFKKAEAQFKTPDQKAPTAQSNTIKAPANAPNGNGQSAMAQAPAVDQSATAPAPAADHSASAQNGSAQPAENASDAKVVKAWLPVDGELVVNEDFSANPTKAAAVADANKKLASGDKTGAMRSLKVASVDVDFIMAVVPLDQTVNDIHQAATLVNDGKYYEASQALRQVQDSTRYDSLDVSGVPKSGAPSVPATH